MTLMPRALAAAVLGASKIPNMQQICTEFYYGIIFLTGTRTTLPEPSQGLHIFKIN